MRTWIEKYVDLAGIMDFVPNYIPERAAIAWTIDLRMSRQGGKLKPLKAPKKEKQGEDEDDKAFKEKKKAEEAALKAAREKATKGSAPPGGGIKKSGKK